MAKKIIEHPNKYEINEYLSVVLEIASKQAKSGQNITREYPKLEISTHNKICNPCRTKTINMFFNKLWEKDKNAVIVWGVQTALRIKVSANTRAITHEKIAEVLGLSRTAVKRDVCKVNISIAIIQNL